MLTMADQVRLKRTSRQKLVGSSFLLIVQIVLLISFQSCAFESNSLLIKYGSQRTQTRMYDSKSINEIVSLSPNDYRKGQQRRQCLSQQQKQQQQSPSTASTQQRSLKPRRRDFVQHLLLATTATVLSSAKVQPVIAAEDDSTFIRRGDKFAYSFIPPPNMEQGQKPLKTHLDEINFNSQTVKKYQIGITVDPVRIQNLKQFGTPEEVAAKVVTAEVNRDGVFEVTLMKDPIEISMGDTVVYQLNYLSDGKRGKKRFIANFCIQNERLYALTAQVLEDNYSELESEILESVNSFRVL